MDGLKNGPCGAKIMKAMNCLVSNKSASEHPVHCMSLFGEMKECMQKYPEEYKDLL